MRLIELLEGTTSKSATDVAAFDHVIVEARALTVPSAKFTWQDGVGSTEISDLGWRQLPQHFYVESGKTGDTRLFLFHETIKQGAGEDEETTGWSYICPGGGLTITIHND